MPEFQFDDTDAVEQKLLPVGWYNLEVESAKPKQSSNGNPMLVVMFRVVDPGEYENCTVFQNFMLSGRIAGITKSFLRAATGDASGGSRSTEELAGCRVRARVTQSVYSEEQGGDGSLRNDVRKFEEYEGSDEVFG